MTEILRPDIDVAAVRDRFSSLQGFAFLDAPGGSQVPDEVGEAIARALRLADAQIGVWAHDSWYSLDLYKRLGYAVKSVRIGFIHYNTTDEVDRLITALEEARRT
jgi:selenocysteine lyase/cysteine desulfurase